MNKYGCSLMLDNLVFVLFWGIIILPFVSSFRSFIKGEEMTQSWFDMREFKLRHVLPPLLLLALGLILGRAWGG